MRILVALLLTLLAISSAAAQDAASFPSRPIRIVVPFPAGGPTDVDIRVIAQRMSADWKQPVVVENRPGGNTAIGAQVVAKAEPDGYTLLAAMDTTLVLNPATATTPLSYDPFHDFATITLTAKNTSLITVRTADGPKSVAELIARAKQNPGKLNYGAGIITTRLAGYQFAHEAGIKVQMIPYKGSTDVVTGLLTGSVDFAVDGVAPSLPLIRAGKLRALAKLNHRPLSVLPDLEPLSVAAGLPQLEDMSSWIGLVAPAGTPQPIVEKIAREVAAIYADPAIADRLEKAGITIATSTPQELDAFFRAEAKRWTAVVRESDIKLQ